MTSDIQKKLESNITKIRIIKMLSQSICFVIPTVVLFWTENGLSFFQIMVLQSFASIAMIVMEVPSGYFADIFGRKKAVIIATFLHTVGLFLYSIGTGFLDFVIADVILSTGFSFLAGADSALVYDSLKEIRKDKSFKKAWGSILFSQFSAIAFFNVIGGFIARVNLRYTFYAAIPFDFLSIFFAISLYEPSRYKVVIEKNYVSNLSVIIKTSLVRNIQLKWILIYSGIIYGLNQSALWFYQPYFQLTNIPIVYFGVIFAAFNIVAGISSHYAHRIEKYIGRRFSIILLCVLLTMSYFLLGNIVFYFSFIFAFVQQFIRGFYEVVMKDYINRIVASERRATVLSLQNMFGRLLYAGVIPILGYITDIFTLTETLTLVGVVSGVLGLSVLFMMKRSRVI